MGGRASSLITDGDDDDELVFMVPSHLTLSVNQMSIMITAGQQPGVPFRLSTSGAERPQGLRKKVRYADNHVALQKHSVKLVKIGGEPPPGTDAIDAPSSSSSGTSAEYSLEFSYDARVPAVVKLFVGTRDVPSSDGTIVYVFTS